MRAFRHVFPAFLALAVALPAEAQSLKGSRSSLHRQNLQARSHDYTYLNTTRHVRRFVDNGYLVPVRGGADYELAAVSFPYARPEVKLFIERLARQYRSACGEKLVVTSLTRPESRQPANASSLSVHPTGMAMDLRRSKRRACRNWLEDTLLFLERQEVLEATRERRPPHYHVALFPKPYARYVAGLGGRSQIAAQQVAAELELVTYRVKRGDSLWTIARRHGTTVDEIKAANELRSARIFAGQVLKLPAR